MCFNTCLSKLSIVKLINLSCSVKSKAGVRLKVTLLFHIDNVLFEYQSLIDNPLLNSKSHADFCLNRLFDNTDAHSLGDPINNNLFLPIENQLFLFLYLKIINFSIIRLGKILFNACFQLCLLSICLFSFRSMFNFINSPFTENGLNENIS